MKPSISLWILMSLLMTGGCFSENDTSNSQPVTLWPAIALNNNDELLCELDYEGDNFFVAQSAHMGIKVGSKLDASSAFSKKSPFSYIIEWSFKDNNGKSVNTLSPPKRVFQNNPSKDWPYLENASYYSLDKWTDELRVNVWIKKCLSVFCDHFEKKSENEKKYKKTVCHISGKN